MIAERCGKWMPRKKDVCARRLDHQGECRTAEGLADSRVRQTARRRAGRRRDDPAAKKKWNRAYTLSRYGLTSAQFDVLLKAQGNACAMCHTQFDRDQVVFIDHDHACCPVYRTSCGACVRGLLCLSCNTALGHIERKYDLARAYLDSPPGQLVVRRGLAS